MRYDFKLTFESKDPLTKGSQWIDDEYYYETYLGFYNCYTHIFGDGNLKCHNYYINKITMLNFLTTLREEKSKFDNCDIVIERLDEIIKVINEIPEESEEIAFLLDCEVRRI